MTTAIKSSGKALLEIAGSLTGVAIIVFALFLVPVATLWQGYVLSILWGWFLAPLLGPSPAIYYLVGLTLFVRFLVKGVDTTDLKPSTEKHGVLRPFLIAFLAPAILLAYAWLWHWLQWGL